MSTWKTEEISNRITQTEQKLHDVEAKLLQASDTVTKAALNNEKHAYERQLKKLKEMLQEKQRYETK